MLRIMLILMILAGLNATGKEDKSTEANTALRFLAMAQASYTEDDINGMVNDFMAENPGVEVIVEFVPYESLRDKTLLAYNSSQAYDVALVDDVWYEDYIQRKLVLDITDSVPPGYREGIAAGGWVVSSRGDNIYGIPLILDSLYLFYNKEMLRKAGYTNPPDSLAELREMAAGLKRQGIVDSPIILSLAQAEALVVVYALFLEAFGGSFIDDQGNYTLDQGEETLQYLIDLKKEGLLNPNSLEYLEEDVRRVFSSGGAAFALNWSYMAALLEDPSESTVSGQSDMTLLPSVEPGKKAAMSGSMAASVMSNSKQPELAKRLIFFMGSQPVMEKYSKVQLPAWLSSFEKPSIKTGRESLVKASKEAFSIMVTRPQDVGYNDASLVIQEELQLALLGQESASEAMDAIRRKTQ